MRFIGIFILIFFTWVVFDFDYDAEDARNLSPDPSHVSSLERMVKWSPVSGQYLFSDMEIASDDAFGSNLDGLNVDQIHEIANERRVILYKKEIESIDSAIEEMKNNGKTTIFLSSNFQKPKEGYIPKEYSTDSLEEQKTIKISQLVKTEDEIDSWFNFRSFPSNMKEIALVINFWTSFFHN